jgi:SAM-dependent methyltransferase
LIEAYYQNAEFYAKAETEEARLMDESRGRLATLSSLAMAYGLNHELLDVGCASGIFLEQAQQLNWQVEGVELSPVLCQKARSKGLKIINGWLEEGCLEARYSMVTAWEVIEHALDPRAFLRAIAARVVPGGLVALSTPLSNGLPARLLRSKFPMLCPPEHLSLFSRMSLQILGVECGLEPVYFRSFSNLSRAKLKRGLRRFVLDSFLPLRLAEVLAEKMSWILQGVPHLVDRMGMGSELEVIFRKVR